MVIHCAAGAAIHEQPHGGVVTAILLLPPALEKD
jgi:hypothetical protein